MLKMHTCKDDALSQNCSTFYSSKSCLYLTGSCVVILEPLWLHIKNSFSKMKIVMEPDLAGMYGHPVVWKLPEWSFLWAVC